MKTSTAVGFAAIAYVLWKFTDLFNQFRGGLSKQRPVPLNQTPLPGVNPPPEVLSDPGLPGAVQQFFDYSWVPAGYSWVELNPERTVQHIMDVHQRALVHPTTRLPHGTRMVRRSDVTPTLTLDGHIRTNEAIGGTRWQNFSLSLGSARVVLGELVGLIRNGRILEGF